MTEEAQPRLVVCVGGSIAAYKACDLVSKLVQDGAHVEVVMTRAAERFVRPLSFAALTHRAVFTNDAWFEGTGGARSPADHLEATERADLLVVAPCTANLIGKFAHGIADEIASTTFLGAACPALIAPAMNHRMWANARVQANVATLKADGVHVVGPDEGYLAEGEAGPGRMAEPAAIQAEIQRLLAS
jgi:phosphopantothenoylcysteine decarboxylase/phosphopantothenate--cysteine ligase